MKFLPQLSNWIKKNKAEFTVILLILGVAAFLRLYHIDQYMTFLGDEGRDMLVMKKLWTEFDVPFIGPPTSVGNMYLGPLYYYMMAVPTLIFWMNPVSAAVMNALIGVLAIGLLYYLCRVSWGKGAAIIASGLYALSPVTIVYGRSSWNPNPAPFFALLGVLGLYQSLKTKNFYWLILTGVAAAFAVQMHYLALILLPFYGIVYLKLVIPKTRKEYSHIWSGTLIAIGSFLLLMVPLVLFDLKHHFVNSSAFMSIFSSKSTSVGVSANFLDRFSSIVTTNLVGNLLATKDPWIQLFIVLTPFIALSGAFYLSRKKKQIKLLTFMTLIWYVVGLAGLSLYKSEVYDHYVGFMNPTIVLLIAASWYYTRLITNKAFRLILSIFLGVLIFVVCWNMLVLSPVFKAPNRQLQRTQDITKEVLNNTQGKPYNFALIAKSNYDSAYQFYLEQYGQKPGQLPFVKTDQLFVVCEDEICQPINNPKYEIAAFGMAKIEWVKDFQGVKLFKLVANPEGKPS